MRLCAQLLSPSTLNQAFSKDDSVNCTLWLVNFQAIHRVTSPCEKDLPN